MKRKLDHRRISDWAYFTLGLHAVVQIEILNPMVDDIEKFVITTRSRFNAEYEHVMTREEMENHGFIERK